MRGTFQVTLQLIDDSNEVITHGNFQMSFDGDATAFENYTMAAANLSSNIGNLISDINEKVNY